MDNLLFFVQQNWLALLAGLVNFVWIYLEYRASIWLWPVGIVLPILYIAVSWNALFLGNIIVNVYYFITSIIGWIIWLRHKGAEGESDEASISHVRWEQTRWHLLLVLLLSYPMYYILKEANSSMPILDSIATLSSFLGMVYLSRKHLEHWFCWIIANSLSLVIFWTAKDYISTFVFGINLIVSVLGYLRWRKEMLAL